MKFDAKDRSSSTPRNFLRLKDKEFVIGVFRGDVYTFHQVWQNGKSTVVPDTDANGQFRFRINLIVKENGALVSKLFEQGYAVYSQLKELHEEYNLEQIFVKITRNGTGTNTTYAIMPMLKQKPELKQMNSVELQHLEHGKRPSPEAVSHFEDVPDPTENDGIGFDEMDEEKLPF